MSEKQPELVVKEKPGLYVLRITNAGLAGKIFQHRIESDGSIRFVRVVPHGGFWGTLGDKNIARSKREAIRSGVSSFLSNRTETEIKSKEEKDFIVAEVLANFPIIYSEYCKYKLTR